MPNRIPPNTHRVLPILGAVAILIAALAGCSREASPTVRVEGRVTYQGKPVTQGSIRFIPVESTGQADLRPAAAALQSDGTYCLSASRDKQGILPGKYAVAVTAYTSPHQLPGQKVEYAVPAKYVNPHTSGLTATVPTDAAGALRFDFELQD